MDTWKQRCHGNCLALTRNTSNVLIWSFSWVKRAPYANRWTFQSKTLTGQLVASQALTIGPHICGAFKILNPKSFNLEIECIMEWGSVFSMNLLKNCHLSWSFSPLFGFEVKFVLPFVKINIKREYARLDIWNCGTHTKGMRRFFGTNNWGKGTPFLL